MLDLSDPAAERAVCAAIFHHGMDAFVDVSDLVAPDSFTIDSNAAFFRCVAYLLERDPKTKLDIPLVVSAAAGLGLGDLLGSRDELKHLRAVVSMPVELGSARKLAAKVKKFQVARDLVARHEEAKASLLRITGDEELGDILGLAEGPVFEYVAGLAATGSQGPSPMGDGVEEYVQHLIDNPRELPGISTGFRLYDRAIGGGLRPNSLDVIGAFTGAGKTQLADNIGFNVAKQGVPVLNLDTEMSREEHWSRVLANLSGVEVREIEKGKFGADPAKKAAVFGAAKLLKSVPYDYLCISGQSFEETIAQMRRWIIRRVGLGANGKAKPCVLIYDYLKLMNTDMLNKNMQEYQALGFITNGLKNFVSRYDTSCLAFVQLNREGLVAQSDRIRWFATSFFTYEEKSADERAVEPGDATAIHTHKLCHDKTRRGEGLPYGDYINMRARYKLARIEEGPTRNGMAAAKPPEGFTINDAGEKIPFV